VSSGPGAGVDIEAEESVCRDGLFVHCQFWNNAGCGMVADSGDGGYTRFAHCSFWGTTSWSVWCVKPGLSFDECVFNGSAVHTKGSPDSVLATRFRRCRFEDKSPLPGKGVYNGGFLMNTDVGGENVTFDECVFVAHASKSVWFNGSAGRGRFVRSTFEHRNSKVAPNDFQCLIRNADVSGCEFREAFATANRESGWFVATGKTRVLPGIATKVTGPQVQWAGKTGIVPPGEY
jgi:hypothetical protein